MTEIHGKKLAAKATNSQRIREMDVELKNVQVASRLSQMLLQQIMQNIQGLTQDLGKAYGIVNELQYKILAMQEVGNFDKVDLHCKAEKLRLADFLEASEAEDVAGKFTVAETVQDDSTVIITSTTKDVDEDDAGIFRSRIKLADCGIPALVEGFKGKPVGTKVTCTLNDVEHVVELLGVRNPPPAAETTGYSSVVEETANDPAAVPPVVH